MSQTMSQTLFDYALDQLIQAARCYAEVKRSNQQAGSIAAAERVEQSRIELEYAAAAFSRIAERVPRDAPSTNKSG